MSRHLEITVISAENLRVNRRPISGRRKTFAVVKADPFKAQITKDDECGGSYPTWNHTFEMEMPMNRMMNDQSVSVEVFYRTGSRHQKEIGSAKIPATDFMGMYSPEGHMNFLSYRLRNEYGDKSGIINVSITVKPESQKMTTKNTVDYGACSSHAVGLWQPSRTMGTALPGGYGGQIVTGFPVWCGYQRPN